MNTIEIDFDVFKELTIRRRSEEVTYNDVLRELLGLTLKNGPNPQVQVVADIAAWFTKSVKFPDGTEFRARYKGQAYFGKVESRALALNGKRFDSPSAAAVSITGKPTNGWTFWECRFPGKTSWQMIKALRK